MLAVSRKKRNPQSGCANCGFQLWLAKVALGISLFVAHRATGSSRTWETITLGAGTWQELSSLSIQRAGRVPHLADPQGTLARLPQAR